MVLMVVVLMVLPLCIVVVDVVTADGVVMGVVVEICNVELTNILLLEYEWKNMCPPKNLHLSKLPKIPLLYMYPVALLCSLSNVASSLTLILLCLKSFILLISKLHCVRPLS